MRIEFIAFIFAAAFLVFTRNIHAADISHSVEKKSYHVSDEVEFDASLSINTSDGTQYYLRGVFFRPGDNNYCGFTWNGTQWFSGPYSTNEQWKKFKKITVTDDTWSGKLKAKIDPDDPGCTQSGEYKFKIQRFTDSGAGSFDNQEESSLTFTIPTPTPTPSNTPTPTRAPTPTKTPTPTPKGPETININSTLSEDENAALTKEILSGRNVYGSNTQASKTSTSTSRKRSIDLQPENDQVNISTSQADTADRKRGSLFVYLGGGSMLTACGILLYQTYKKRKEE